MIPIHNVLGNFLFVEKKKVQIYLGEFAICEWLSIRVDGGGLWDQITPLDFTIFLGVFSVRKSHP